MSIKTNPHRRSLLAVIVFITAIALAPRAAGQQAQGPQPQSDEVIRISTELVQTGVTVFDKQGRFVEGLKPEQFELRVDGKPVTLSFFERVTAGTPGEEKVVAAAARASAPAPAPGSIPSATTVRGRTIIFFIDDLHLSAESVDRTRKTILEFVENQMGPADQVLIASASGQIGFLQQFTDLKPVLRAAIARLNHKPYTVRDAENITMTEYTALRIDQGDRDASDYYVNELLKATNVKGLSSNGGKPSSPFGGRTPQTDSGPLTRETAERIVKERAQVLLKQSAAVTIGTLTSLESLMRSSSNLPGRKLVFFISDGFYLNDRNTGYGDKLKQITDAATRAGVIIYTIDARGIISLTDSTSNRADPQGRLARAGVGEVAASQDPLSALAGDTGGRALLNAGALVPAVTNALKETSNYYLLAWKPETEDQKGGKFKRVEISIVGRPELTVRLPRGFVAGQSAAAARGADAKSPASDVALQAGAAKGPDADIRSAMLAPTPKRGLPTQVSVGFVDVPNTGPVMTADVQMATDVLGYGAEGKQPAAIDLAGIVLNDQGKQVGGFKTRVNVNPLSDTSRVENPGVVYSNKVPLKPGIYQVRVAARDEKSGRVGSASRWIEIPDLAARKLTLSSLMVGGQFIGSAQKQAGGDGGGGQLQFSVDRRFKRGSHLNFLTLIYNAARAAGGSGAPELEAQINISRDGQSIVTSPLRKLAVEAGADLARIPYGADIALQNLPAGLYTLQVTINDRAGNASASQQVTFDIEN